MAPTRSDGRMTELAEPETPDDGVAGAADDGTQPFGDWREQLRERVKEIRARKLASRREAVDDLDLGAMPRATAEEPAEPADALPSSETSVTPVQVAEEISADESEDPVTGVELDAIELDGDVSVDAASEVELEHSSTSTDEDQDLDAELSTEDDADSGREATTGLELDEGADAITFDGLEIELDGGEAPLSMATSGGGLEQIPPELRDVDIPAWALPREPSLQQPVRDEAEAETETNSVSAAAAADADSTPAAADPEVESAADTRDQDTDADTYLVGEYSSPAQKRVDLGPPPDTPSRTEDLLDKTVGELSALDEAGPAIAPPGGLVDRDSIRPIQVSEREQPSEPPSAFPGLFDEEGDEPAFNEPAQERTPHPLDDIELAIEPDADEPTLEPDDAIDELATEAVANVEVEAAAEEPLEHEPDEATDEQAVAEPELDEPVELPGAPAWAKARPATQTQLTEAELGSSETADSSDESGLEWDDDSLESEAAAARERHDDPTAPMADRVFSAVADGLVLLMIGVVLVIAGASAAGTPILSFVQAAPLPFLAAWMLFGIVYGVLFIGTCGQTLGKMAMRVRVIGAERFHVGYGTAALRAVAYGASALPAGLGLLPALKDPQHRGLHDRLTGTRVVKA